MSAPDRALHQSRKFFLRQRWVPPPQAGSLVHLYLAERAVPDQDASFRASRLGVAGPIFGDGREPRRAPVTCHPRPPDAPQADGPDEPGCQTTLRRAPSGTSPVLTYRHKATSSFRASATAVILRMRPRTAPTRSVNQRARALSGW